MAKYLGLITADARGKFGGAVFTRSTGNSVLRSRGAPIAPRSPNQLANRARFSATCRTWRKLTANEQLSWLALAAQVQWQNVFGRPYQPQAQQLFSQCQMNLALAGAAPLTTAPTLPLGLQQLLSVTSYWEGTYAFGLNVVPATATGPYKILLYGAAPLQAQLLRQRPTLYRFLESVTIASGSFDTTASYTRAFGFPARARICGAARLVHTPSGFSSALLYAQLPPI